MSDAAALPGAGSFADAGPEDTIRRAVSSPARLAALYASGLVGEGSDAALDRLTSLARRALGAPFVMLTLVGESELLCRSVASRDAAWRSGLRIPELHSCCRYVVAAARPLATADGRQDPRLRSSPAVCDYGVVAYLGVPVRAPSGEVLGAFCALDDGSRHWSAEDLAILRDFAALAEAEIRLRVELREQARATRAFELLDRLNRALVAELDLGRLVRLVTDLGRELVEADYCAFFYNAPDADGDGYRLFTLSGAPEDAFGAVGMPRKTAVFAPTFEGRGVVRADDIAREPQFGRNPPYNGFPPGHPPVRSYLAAPVVGRDGEVIGGLFFGHAEPGRFDALCETLVTRLAAKAAIAFTNARLYGDLRRELAERQRVEANLRAREEHIRLLLDSTAEGIYGLDLDGRCTFCNRAALRLLGYEAPEELVGREMHALIHHTRADGSPYPVEECRVYRAIRTGEPTHCAEEVLWRRDGTPFHAEYWSYPTELGGERVGSVVTFLDISDRVEAEHRQRLLLRELNHRVRNTLAVVQSIARQTLRRAPSPDVFVDAFEDRLQALARAHRVLTDNRWAGADIRDLLDQQLGVLVDGRADALDADGPPVFLAAEAAVPLALILHELATNAVKYGALGVPGGRVEVRWQRTAEKHGGRVHLVWRERGGPPVAPPQRTGLGSLLVGNGLGSGCGRMRFERDGLVCELDLPLARQNGAGGGVARAG